MACSPVVLLTRGAGRSARRRSSAGRRDPRRCRRTLQPYDRFRAGPAHLWIGPTVRPHRGTDSVRKNLDALTQAAQQLAHEGIDMVVAGGERGYLPSGGGPVAVRRLGYVSELHLPALYAGARALVLPSRYERVRASVHRGNGCGSSGGSGRRHRASRHLPWGRRAGGSRRRSGFAAALLRLAGDGPVRTERISAGLGRAAALSWDKTTEEVDRVLAATQRRCSAPTA